MTTAEAVRPAAAAASSSKEPAAQFAAEAGMVLGEFGEYAENILGIIRSAKSPLARAQTIASHLPQQGGTSSYRAVGLAVREYINQDNADFNARHFAGFVERAEKTRERRGGRRALKQEARHIDREQIDRDNATREEAEANRLLASFRSENPKRYSELEGVASAGARGTPELRAIVTRSALIPLIRRELNQPTRATA